MIYPVLRTKILYTLLKDHYEGYRTINDPHYNNILTLIQTQIDREPVIKKKIKMLHQFLGPVTIITSFTYDQLLTIIAKKSKTFTFNQLLTLLNNDHDQP